MLLKWCLYADARCLFADELHYDYKYGYDVRTGKTPSGPPVETVQQEVLPTISATA